MPVDTDRPGISRVNYRLCKVPVDRQGAIGGCPITAWSAMGLGGALALLMGVVSLAAADESPYFKIRVVDQETGRGVPLVELETTGAVRYYTDSNGLVAFHEPGLMDRKVFFHVRSHGYDFPEDGFGMRGVALRPVAGGSTEIRLRRINVAERLYRITGGGIYRDSVLLGEPVAIKEPVLNGRVMGQDSVLAIPYRGKIYWFWGDTNRVSYPLGNFAASGATSGIPGAGGLDPAVGVDLSYFVDEKGFSRPMFPLEGPGPKWIDGLMLLRDAAGRERLVGKYVRVKKLGVLHERGLCTYEDGPERFRKLCEFDLESPLVPHGHPVRHGGHYYFGRPFPNVRVAADLEQVQDPGAYEGWRDDLWQHAPPEEVGRSLRDIESGKAVKAHGGSVFWNEYRKRWVAIILEAGGDASYLGEVWYAEGDTLLGPWVYARKVVTHDKQSFYNPKHHPFFDQEGGRLIYFEGTYVNTFSGNPDRTPRYNYNQIMYRLDLADPRLNLPVPVYRLRDGSLGTGAAIRDMKDVEAIPFFAMERPGPGLVPVGGTAERPLFYGLPPDEEGPSLIPYEEDARVVARVWRNPTPEK